MQLNFQPRPYQPAAAQWLSRRKRGAIIAPAGSGKTLILSLALWLAVNAKARAEKVKVGWVCMTVEQSEQAAQALCIVFGVCNKEDLEKEWKQKGAAWMRDLNLLIDVRISCAAAFRSAAFRDWSWCDVLIVDEFHHAEIAPSWKEQIETCKNARWGMSATPPEDAEDLQRLKDMFGGEMFVINRAEVGGNLAKARVVLLDASDPGVGVKIDEHAQKIYNMRTKWGIRQLNLRITGNSFAHKDELKTMGCAWCQVTKSWYAPDADTYYTALAVCGGEIPNQLPQQASQSPVTKGEAMSRALWEACIKHGIVENAARNDAAVAAARKHVTAGNHVLVLVNQVEHGGELAARIPGALLCNSAMGRKKRTAAIEGFKNGSVPCLVATSLLDEGADLPIADVLVMVSGGRSRGKAEQRTGRVLRVFAGKSEALIYDFRDRFHKLMEKHSGIRLQLYRELGYKIDE